jgi:hypothetical protein
MFSTEPALVQIVVVVAWIIGLHIMLNQKSKLRDISLGDFAWLLVLIWLTGWIFGLWP